MVVQTKESLKEQLQKCTRRTSWNESNLSGVSNQKAVQVHVGCKKTPRDGETRIEHDPQSNF